MRSAVIVDAVRTPIGRRDGALRDWHPVDLASTTFEALQARNDLDPALIDDVIMGCVMQVGEQGSNLGRNAVLAAGWPESVPATTIDRQCGSGQQALHFAAQGVMAGAYDVVIAAGVEAMTRVPMGASTADGKFGYPFGPKMTARYADDGGLISQGIAAELIAEQWGFTREELDRFGHRSQQLAGAATDAGHFDAEIVTLTKPNGTELRTDEGVRPTSLDALSRLHPAFVPAADGGRVTAGNASQVSDGAAALLIMSEQRAIQLDVTPLARFVGFGLAGVSPRTMLSAPIPATQQLLDRVGMTLDDIDRYEVNEAFASVVLAWQREMDADVDRMNVNGGAIALGHPLGASGARLMTTLVHELARSGSRYGLQAMSAGGGLANATLIECLA